MATGYSHGLATRKAHNVSAGTNKAFPLGITDICWYNQHVPCSSLMAINKED
ncbi:unnamed protein product [Dovyalis caffra]|uniref:Uncharacterized protein n=1 Tax=Dovyalis caffra TaxID=77055 RepID=A0AAV1S6X8_9ROSI|nr:unnamed protein product [Dovyalis caffra]